MTQKKGKKLKYIWNVVEREGYDGQETRFKDVGLDGWMVGFGWK